MFNFSVLGMEPRDLNVLGELCTTDSDETLEMFGISLFLLTWAVQHVQNRWSQCHTGPAYDTAHLLYLKFRLSKSLVLCTSTQTRIQGCRWRLAIRV